MTEVGDALHEFFKTGSVSARMRVEAALMQAGVFFEDPTGPMFATEIFGSPGVLMFRIEDVFSQPGYHHARKTYEERRVELWIRDASRDALRRAGFKIDTVENG